MGKWLTGCFPGFTNLPTSRQVGREGRTRTSKQGLPMTITLLNRPISSEDHVGIEPTLPYGSGFADQRVYHSANDPSIWSGWWGSNPRSLRSERSTFAT